MGWNQPLLSTASVHTCRRTAVTSRASPKSSVTHTLVLIDASHNVVRSPSAAKVELPLPSLEDSSTTTEAFPLQWESKRLFVANTLWMHEYFRSRLTPFCQGDSEECLKR